MKRLLLKNNEILDEKLNKVQTNISTQINQIKEHIENVKYSYRAEFK